MARARRQGDASELRPRTVECEVLAGLEPFCAAEVRRVLGASAELLSGVQDAGDAAAAAAAGVVRFRLVGPLAPLLELRTAVAAYLQIPRRAPVPAAS